MRRAAEKYALFVGAEKSGKHFFANTLSFPGTQICRKNLSAQLDLSLRLGTNCGNIFGKQVGNVFVFTICFDVGLAVLC